MDDKMYFLQNKTKKNQKKEIGVQQVEVDSKTIIEAVV